MRKWIALLAGIAVLGLANLSIWQRERLLADGQVVLLQLTPVDPRSFMQGDYMALRFAAADQAFPSSDSNPRRDGHIVVALDNHRVGSFRRIADKRPLGPGEMALRYRIRAGDPKFATNAFFFQEGTADLYANARYGEFRVASDGEMILTGLRDEAWRPLGPGRVH